jgi:FkbM family methyltransferase
VTLLLKVLIAGFGFRGLRAALLMTLDQGKMQMHLDSIVFLGPTRTLVETRTNQLPEPKIKPLQCETFLQQVAAGTHPGKVEDPSMGVNYTRITATTYPFHISVNNVAYDSLRFKIYETGIYYERKQVEVWEHILKNAKPGSRVVDIGANIGFYALAAAAMTPIIIDAFEPNLVNDLRMCESALLNGWHGEYDGHRNSMNATSKININPFGLSDTSGTFTFFHNKDNPGASSFNEIHGGKVEQLEVTTLEIVEKDRQWIKNGDTIAAMKVDAEGLGAKILLGGRDLLRSGIVRNILIETDKHKERNMQQTEIEALQLLVDSGYKLAGYGWRLGPSVASKWSHDKDLPRNIYHELMSHTRAPYLNLWWTLDEANLTFLPKDEAKK